MPKREDLRRLMIIGSGPIVIGAAGEFDYSGSQATKSLREEGYEVVVVNSNPATIQTDLSLADRVYLEPLTAEVVEQILERERPQGILSGMGGQTALNLCSELSEQGVLQRLGVELLGTQASAIAASEDRDLFAKTMASIGQPVMASTAVTNVEDGLAAADRLGYPVILRAAYTLGGLGSGICNDRTQLRELLPKGLAYSRIHQVLVEECVLGWKEFEYEIVRDNADTCITICNMENLDAMGIHTGESIVVSPAQTLSDADHQQLRSAALDIIRTLDIRGGCNIQYATNPIDGQYRVIEVNPRVSRSSALASKATGYPIARVAAKIAVGLNLHEIPNAVTGKTMASFEPTLDYVVLKTPSWPFEKFRTADRHIGTQMKSTGEVMAIGRSIEEALLKAIRSLDVNRQGFQQPRWGTDELVAELVRPTDRRLFAIAEALRQGMRPSTIADLTKWDEFFVRKVGAVVAMEQRVRTDPSPLILREAFSMGFTPTHLARILNRPPEELREQLKLRRTFKMVDTCGAEFSATTPYYYSTFEEPLSRGQMAEGSASQQEEGTRSGRTRKVVIVGGGPFRIGQGIEFDTCAVNGVQALREAGIEAVVVNNNPETVSTDFDISDRLYFEPLTLDDLVEVLHREEPEGVILQFGGQTAINLALPLERYLRAHPQLPTRILGTSAEAMDRAEDRNQFDGLLERLEVLRPAGGTGYSFSEVRSVAHRIGYPVLVRPSYVLGGRGMEIVYDERQLEQYMETAVKVSPDHPVLVDKYLTEATELDVDAVCDGTDVFIGGIMEHIEQAGVHSGDASCVLPPQNLSGEVLNEVRRVTRQVSIGLGVVGLINIQLAVKEGRVFMIEANPRASRTVPFVSKAIHHNLARVATLVMVGRTLKEQGLVGEAAPQLIAVKAPVFPFLKLPGVDAVLGPEMKSTGEVMGIDRTFERGYFKASLGSGNALPLQGNVYLTMRDPDKPGAVEVARMLRSAGLGLYASKGTAGYLRDHGIEVTTAWLISEARSPDALDLMRSGKVQLVINTPTAGSGSQRDGYMMRRLAVELGIPFLTTLSAARAAARAILAAREHPLEVQALHDIPPAPIIPVEGPSSAAP